jgi:uncharacterized membrane protein
MSKQGAERRRRTRPLPIADGSRTVALLAAAFGLAVSSYLAVEHYSHSVSLACPQSATIDCLKVTTSRWSVVGGVPLAVLGVVYFAVMIVLLALPGEHRRLRAIRITSAGAGVVMALYLIHVELFDVGAICLWCSAVHAITGVMFAAVLWHDLGVNTQVDIADV